VPATPELLVLTGLAAAGAEQVIAPLRASDPDLAVLHHDLRDAARGVVHRRLRHRGLDEWTTLPPGRADIPRTLCEDVRALARPGAPARILLHLDPVLEPEPVCGALTEVLPDGPPVPDLRGVVAVVDVGSWLDDATGDVTPAERGLAALPGDERTLAQVAVGQAELADVVVRTGTADAWRLARTDAVLARLAPGAPRVLPAELREPVPPLGVRTRRGRVDGVHDPLLRGTPPLEPECGVRLTLFAARRPFHPERLHDAVDVLLDGVVRTRGRVWLATRPDAVLWLESAGGGLRVGHAGDWLAAGGPAAWEAASPDRRAMAALSWDDRFGDRAQHLTVLTHEADPAGIHARLRAALLTDAELAAGPAAWARLPDPFGWWHADPCGDPADAVTGLAQARPADPDER